MKEGDSYLILDDDTTSTLLGSAILRLALGAQIDLRSFNKADQAVDYLAHKLSDNTVKPTVLFLDINMPGLSGWDVLDAIQEMSENAKGNLKVFMLSSSIDLHDRNRASEHPLVTGFIEKPLSVEKVKILFGVNY